MSRKKILIVLSKIEKGLCTTDEIRAATGFSVNFIRKTVAQAERDGLVFFEGKRKSLAGGAEKIWRSTKAKPEPRPVDALKRTPWEAACHFA